MNRSSAKQKEREAAIKRRMNKEEKPSRITAPIVPTKKIRNKKAEAILRRLKRQA